ncbi:MAG: hypothetical protein Q4G51_08010 [Dermatophilus congolensis]|nr:hypothetical protein [Dermatophilus congolensis]
MADTRSALRDASVLWVLDGSYQRVVDAAVACIVANTSTPAVDVLAGSHASDAYGDRLAIVRDALDELRLAPLPEDPAELAGEGAAIITRSVDSGAMSKDDVDTWVTGSLTCEVRSTMENALDKD